MTDTYSGLCTSVLFCVGPRACRFSPAVSHPPPPKSTYKNANKTFDNRVKTLFALWYGHYQRSRWNAHLFGQNSFFFFAKRVLFLSRYLGFFVFFVRIVFSFCIFASIIIISSLMRFVVGAPC